MLEFVKEHGWSFLLTLNAIGGFGWNYWVTRNLRTLLRERRLKQWANAYEKERVH